MSGWRGRGPRARAASTSRANAAARSGGTARSHSAVICLTLTFASARCSRSCLDRFVIWSSSRKRGIGADWDTYFALIWGACLGLTSKACSAPSGRRASLRWDAGPTCGYGSRPRTVWASACMAAAVGDGVFNGHARESTARTGAADVGVGAREEEGTRPALHATAPRTQPSLLANPRRHLGFLLAGRTPSTIGRHKLVW